ncbi:uncharacterized protein [Eucyclogobius newberryi]|uniref:uncharacterized protein n=1 Tax=Eucyclogobius newberryi TaxID=166745 RepID=UPI003B5C3672
MSDENNVSLYDLLNLSIGFPGQSTVNFRALYTLLHGILRQLDLRDITVRFSDTSPAESALEPGREEEQPRSGSGAPREESLADEHQVLELIHRIQQQTERLQDNVKELHHQQDETSAAQSQWVKELESYGQRVDALEEAARRSQEDYVTWEAMKSALVTERQTLQKDPIQTIKDEALSNTGDKDAPVAPDPGSDLVSALKSLSPVACKYKQTVEALRNMGRLKQRCDRLEERLSVLDLERSREEQELQRLSRELLQQKDVLLLYLSPLLHSDVFPAGSDEAFDAVKEELSDQRALLRRLMSDRDKSAHLVSGVQKAILHLQSECEKLHETTRCLHEDNEQKQTHIEELYETTEELEKRKADKNMVQTEMRAERTALDSKVSQVQFDSVTEQLSNMFHELLSKVTDQEQDWSNVMEKLSTEMDRKLNRIELDSVKKQLEARWKSIQERMKNEGALEQDDAAGIRKQLVERFHCLSCDRPVVKQTPGPQLLTLPASPGFQPHRSLRPFTVYTLEQIRQHYRSERVLEVADYSLYSVSRSCGGSHTLTSFNQRHRSALQHGTLQQNRSPTQLDDSLGQVARSKIYHCDQFSLMNTGFYS